MVAEKCEVFIKDKKIVVELPLTSQTSLVRIKNKDSLPVGSVKKQNLDKILVLLKNFTKIMKKEFAAVKETNISGVILLENFKI